MSSSIHTVHLAGHCFLCQQKPPPKITILDLPREVKYQIALYTRAQDARSLEKLPDVFSGRQNAENRLKETTKAVIGESAGYGKSLSNLSFTCKDWHSVCLSLVFERISAKQTQSEVFKFTIMSRRYNSFFHTLDLRGESGPNCQTKPEYLEDALFCTQNMILPNISRLELSFNSLRHLCPTLFSVEFKSTPKLEYLKNFAPNITHLRLEMDGAHCIEPLIRLLPIFYNVVTLHLVAIGFDLTLNRPTEEITYHEALEAVFIRLSKLRHLALLAEQHSITVPASWSAMNSYQNSVFNLVSLEISCNTLSKSLTSFLSSLHITLQRLELTLTNKEWSAFKLQEPFRLLTRLVLYTPGSTLILLLDIFRGSPIQELICAYSDSGADRAAFPAELFTPFLPTLRSLLILATRTKISYTLMGDAIDTVKRKADKSIIVRKKDMDEFLRPSQTPDKATSVMRVFDEVDQILNYATIAAGRQRIQGDSVGSLAMLRTLTALRGLQLLEEE